MSPAQSRPGPLLHALNQHGVAYVVTGSVGAAAYGIVGDDEPEDLDIVPGVERANLVRLGVALDSLSAVRGDEYGEWVIDEMGEHTWQRDDVKRPALPYDPADLTTVDGYYRTRAGQIDIVPEVAGHHGALRHRAARGMIDGEPAWIAHPADLLTAMTRPRRPKDVPRVRALRELVGQGAGIGFIGFRTDRFPEMVAFFRDLVGLEILHEATVATRFRLGADAELHVYAASDPDHAFFTTGPVAGLRVADVDATRGRMAAAGLEMLTEVERTEAAAWCHLRAPDGTVLEIIGPPDLDRGTMNREA